MNKITEREKTLLPRFVLKEESTHILSVRVDKNGKLLLDHYHSVNLTTSSSGGNHTHPGKSIAGDCGSGYTHDNFAYTYGGGSSHSHSVSGNTGDTVAYDLNHTHTVNLTTTTNSIPSHSHSARKCGFAGCTACSIMHDHTLSGSSASASKSHSHSVSGNTQTGQGTIDNHYHTISLSTNSVSHTHAVGTLTVGSQVCDGGYNHTHTISGYLPSVSHSHSVSGSTGYAACEIPPNQPPSPPTSLLCEGQTNPHGVADTTPEFSAIYNDPDTGDTATHAYIQVNTTSDFTGTMMWDSGWIDIPNVTEGNRCEDITYAGTSLSLNGKKYYWRIKFKDDDGAEGEWSAVAEFTMASIEKLLNGYYDINISKILNNEYDIELSVVLSAIYNIIEGALPGVIYFSKYFHSDLSKNFR